MRRMQVQHRTPRRTDSGRDLPPVDPRDPDVIRAKRLRERAAELTAKTSR